LKVHNYSVGWSSIDVYVHMKYAYDNADIEGGTVRIPDLDLLEHTNSTGWATFDLASIPDFWGKLVYGVQDATYGITHKFQNLMLPLAKKAARLIESNMDISALSWDGVKLTVEFSGTTGSYTLRISGSRPVYVLNATYDFSTDYSDHLSIGHDGSKSKIVAAWPTWGDFYVRGLTDGVLTSVKWEGQKMVLILDGTSGSSGVLVVHCGSRGHPGDVSGFSTTPSYDSSTTILDGPYTLASATVITLDWTMQLTGETGETSGTTIPVGGVGVSVSFTVGAVLDVKPEPGQVVDTLLNFSWMGVNEIKIVDVDFFGAAGT